MFRTHKFILQFITVLFLLSSIAATAQSQDTVTLDQLINELMKNNPSLQAAQARYLAARARPSQVRTLPDPLISFVTRNNTGNPIPFTRLGDDEFSSFGFMWEQEFPYPGKLDIAGK